MPIIRFSGAWDSILLLKALIFLKQNEQIFPLSGINKDYLQLHDGLGEVLLKTELCKLSISIGFQIWESVIRNCQPVFP